MTSDADVHLVLRAYAAELRPQRVAAMGGAGGFSGAEFWRVWAPAGELCLRRWPRAHPDLRRLQFIHDVLRHVYGKGFVEIPQPFATLAGDTWVLHDGRYWELARWLPGQADFRQRGGSARLTAAMTALARFHLAAADFAAVARRPSPGIAERRQLLEQLADSDRAAITARLSKIDWPEFAGRARRILEHFDALAAPLAGVLRSAAGLSLPLQPAIRDIWHDHVLFTGDQVSGFVDFGALRIETVAGDVARLLGSLAVNDRNAWRIGLEAYQTLRPLSADEQAALTAMDASGLLLSGMNWLRWIYLDGRQFEDRQQVLARLDEALMRLDDRRRRGFVFEMPDA